MFWQVALKLLKESVVPAVLAMGYAYWGYTTGKSKNPADAVGSGAAAFFFAMWFVGQYLRASKQIGDKRSLENLDAKVSKIIEAVVVADKKNPARKTSPETQPSITDPVARAIMNEAAAAIEANHLFSGLLAATVAFDHALRRAAVRMLGSDTARLGHHQLIRSMSAHLPPEEVRELDALRIARNELVHLQGKVPDAELAQQLWTGFQWAISYLERLPIGREETDKRSLAEAYGINAYDAKPPGHL